MSRRTAEANKAIRLAWERERELIRQGKGTRDWTRQQQLDILDLNKGNAYDDKGRAFEGQHMRSVEEYPEYQGNPDNIQFLTKDEHFEAHKGSWQNATNWYYDPVTKEYTDFGDGEIIPCEVIDLTDPVIVETEAESESEEETEADVEVLPGTEPNEEELEQEKTITVTEEETVKGLPGEEPSEVETETKEETEVTQHQTTSSGSGREEENDGMEL